MLSADKDGFTEFVATRGAALQRSAYLLTGDHHLAQDLVQTALMAAAGRWERIHTSPEAYVRRSIFTANVSRWRRIKFTEQALAYDTPAPQSRVEDLDSRVALRAALERLTVKQRAVLVLRYYEDLTEVQTAEVLGFRRTPSSPPTAGPGTVA